jgi:hypothetical protein
VLSNFHGKCELRGSASHGITSGGKNETQPRMMFSGDRGVKEIHIQLAFRRRKSVLSGNQVAGLQKERFQLSFSRDSLQFSEGGKWYQNYYRPPSSNQERI